MDTIKVYYPEELSGVLDIPHSEIVDLLESGELGGKKVLNHWRISERDICEFLENKNKEINYTVGWRG
ncbi:helix-turn-helix domain-containing protein [Halarsenatibacter silvermanii]|uniref:Helix-turn-helix domain-containing protein n=1 Tax=Halarsenatibacter silvermanii TaxID=321763 RepID=A0A1G9SQ41_9FIRM|nr:helix-turn-helix domain-containing protein [Halarsenatibacter silvermanii]SDM37494.1 hypothetical protein SAMN04488692_13019 [Halarsenatibacter silvermanii]